jgi:cysteine desulfuration protein SufE
MTRFGIDISSADIADNLSFFDSWDDRYKYIIELGKELPAMDAADHVDENLIRGCQSKVWLSSESREGRLYFNVDSDAFIVKGLLAIVLAAYNGKTLVEVRAFDIQGFFESIDLMRHLSTTRGSGLQAMVARIQSLAANP